METNRAKIIQLLYTGEPTNVALAFQLATSQGISLAKELEIIRYFYINGSKGAIRRENLEEIISVEEMITELRTYRYSSFMSTFPKDHYHALSLLEELTEISFYYTSFETFPLELYELRALWSLVAFKGKLKKLDAKLANLEQLRILSLINNKLETIPGNIGKNIALQELYLNNNELTYLPKSIGQLQNLKILFLGGNKLQSLPEELKLLKNLKRFSVYGNPLDRSKIPDSLLEGDDLVASQLRRIFLYK